MAYDPTNGQYKQDAAPTFNFDPNQYLPGIQQEAASIYNPQLQALDTLGQIQSRQTEQQKITTRDQFNDELTRAVESYNARGAFFGGGAIAGEGKINQRRTDALTNIDLNAQLGANDLTSKKATLGAEQTQYVNDRLSGQRSSAYNMFQDSLNNYWKQQDFEQGQSNTYWQKEMQKKDMELRKKELKAKSKADKKAVKEARRQFEEEMKYKYAALNRKDDGLGIDVTAGGQSKASTFNIFD